MKKIYWSILIGAAIAAAGVGPAAAGNWLQGIQSLQSGANTAGSVVGTMKSIGSMMPKGKAKAQVEDEEQAADETSDDAPQKPKATKASKKQKATNSKFELTKTTNPIKGRWGNLVTCAGPNSATCQNGMDNLVNCMHQTKGYYYRLVAKKLEQKLENGEDDVRGHCAECPRT